MGLSTMSQSWTYTQIHLHRWTVDSLTSFLTPCWPVWYTLEIWAIDAELNCTVQPKSGVKSAAGREIKRQERSQEEILQKMISRKDVRVFSFSLSFSFIFISLCLALVICEVGMSAVPSLRHWYEDFMRWGPCQVPWAPRKICTSICSSC